MLPTSPFDMAKTFSHPGSFPPDCRVAPVSEQEVAIKILNYNDKLILRLRVAQSYDGCPGVGS